MDQDTQRLGFIHVPNPGVTQAHSYLFYLDGRAVGVVDFGGSLTMHVHKAAAARDIAAAFTQLAYQLAIAEAGK